jgi:hypothetical protein
VKTKNAPGSSRRPRQWQLLASTSFRKSRASGEVQCVLRAC